MPDPRGQSFVHPDKWTPYPAEWDSAAIEGENFSARRIPGLGQTLVSGDLAAAQAALAPGAPMLGLWQVAESLPAFVRIARDRAMLVSQAPLGLEEGWRAGSFALSPADDAWGLIELEGDALADLMGEANAAPLASGSPSASTMFAGVPCLIYRTALAVARLHIETPLLPYVWHWLEERKG